MNHAMFTVYVNKNAHVDKSTEIKFAHFLKWTGDTPNYTVN